MKATRSTRLTVVALACCVGGPAGPAAHGGQDWLIALVEPDVPSVVQTGSTQNPSLAFDPVTGRVAVAYWRTAPANTLRYAEFDGASWQIVDADPGDWPGWSGGTVSSPVSLSFFADGRPAIAFNGPDPCCGDSPSCPQCSAQAVWFVERDESGTWLPPVAVRKREASDPANGFFIEGISSNTAMVVEPQPSLVSADAALAYRLTYCGFNGTWLSRVAARIGGQWGEFTTASGQCGQPTGPETISLGGDLSRVFTVGSLQSDLRRQVACQWAAWYPSNSCPPDGNPSGCSSLVHADVSSPDVSYRAGPEGWGVAYVDDATDNGTNDLYYADGGAGAGGGGPTLVDTGPSCTAPSLALDVDRGNPTIAYVAGESTLELRLARSDGATWQVSSLEQAATSSGVPHLYWQGGTSVAVDPGGGGLAVAYGKGGVRVARQVEVPASGPTWTLHAPADQPPPRYQYGMAYDAARERVVVFGGSAPAGGGVLGDAWEWDGRTWTLRAAGGGPGEPTPRRDHAMSYDADRGAVVVFGGSDGVQNSAQTWALDEDGWTLRSTSGPSPRRYVAMAYDAARGRTVLFGGLFESGGWVEELGDTWEWDGERWIQRSAGGPGDPDPRDAYGMAYDADRQRVVLFGGEHPLYNDTWEWNGQLGQWQKIQPPAGSLRPIPRDHHAMAYDPRVGRVVLFGGWDGGLHDDTWEWDGVIWTHLPMDPRPAPQATMKAVFDAARGRIVTLIAEQTEGGGFESRTWTLDRAACGADTNGDGVVDVSDLVNVVLAWGPCPAPPAPCLEDLDGDGTVDVLDLIEIILSWGPCGP